MKRKKQQPKKCKSCYREADSGNYCYACRMRKWRAKDPMRAAFHNGKNNAKRRGIYWGLTFEEFKELCHETDYIAGKGKTSKSYSLDRDKEGPLPGYVKSNINVMPLGINSKKEAARRKNKKLIYDWERNKFYVVDQMEILNNSDHDNPF